MYYNEEELKKWSKFVLFYLDIKNESAIKPVLMHMLRQLSRGRIPSKKLIEEVLGGSRQVPNCGYIGCCLEQEHVH